MITLAEINEAYRNASNEERQDFINLILPSLNENHIFKNAVEIAIADSELNILSRLRKVEIVTGNYQFEDFEEHEPTIPEQITALSEKITAVPEPSREEIPVKTYTKLEQKAKNLVEKLKIKPRSPTGEIAMDNTELHEYIESEIPEELRGKDKNIRRFKARVIQKAKELYPNLVEISKNKYGRHETRIFLKQPYQRKGAVRTPLFLAGELL